LKWYIVEWYIVFKKYGSIKERTQTSTRNGRQLSTKRAPTNHLSGRSGLA